MKTFKRGNLRVELDREQVFEDNPGAGTPAMVYWKVGGKEFSSTYWCAIETGEMLCTGDLRMLTEAQVKWLDSLDEKIDKFLYGDDSVTEN